MTRVESPGPYCSKCGHRRSTDVACRWSSCECIRDHACTCTHHPRFPLTGGVLGRTKRSTGIFGDSPGVDRSGHTSFTRVRVSFDHPVFISSAPGGRSNLSARTAQRKGLSTHCGVPPLGHSGPMFSVAALLAGASLAGLLVGPREWGLVGLVTAVLIVGWTRR